jgi:hypothetical protein
MQGTNTLLAKKKHLMTANIYLLKITSLALTGCLCGLRNSTKLHKKTDKKKRVVHVA